MSAASNVSRETLYKTLCVAAISLIVILTAGSLLAQDTDLQFHKFHPQATSPQPATATSQQAAAR